MMMYKITFSPEAEIDLAKLKRSEPASFKKAVKLLNELVEHPQHPEPLKDKLKGRRNHKIIKKYRMPYRFFDAELMVVAISTY